jgi:hypothetical protein
MSEQWCLGSLFDAAVGFEICVLPGFEICVLPSEMLWVGVLISSNQPLVGLTQSEQSVAAAVLGLPLLLPPVVHCQQLYPWGNCIQHT